jgi:hypothetical protein
MKMLTKEEAKVSSQNLLEWFRDCVLDGSGWVIERLK